MAAAVVAALLKAGARRRPWPIVAAAAAVAALLSLTPLSAPLSRDMHDVQLRLLAPRQASAEVVVFDIDDASLAELKAHFGPWPFKRDVYALVVEQLRDLGARAIAIDLLLADSAEGDASLARTLARPGAPVVLAAAGLRHASDLPRAPGRAGSPAALPAPGATASSAGSAGPAYPWPTLALPTASVWPEGRPPRLGVITTPLDQDGVLRALPLWHQDLAQQRLPVMPWAVHMALQDAAATAPPLDTRGAYSFALPAGEAWPPARRFAELAQVALGQRDPAALRHAVQGRIVYVGSSALLADAVMTPQGQVSGTMVLAQATAALRQGSWVWPPSAPLDAALVLVALLPGLVTVWRGRPAPPRDAAAAALALAAMVGLALWALFQWRQPSDWVTPLATLAAAWSASLFVHHRGQAAARRRLAHELAVSEEAARAKSAFLANVSHEIRTPLNALLGVADLLADSELTPKQRLHVQVFRESGRALHSLINDLLDLSRIEAGRLELHPAPFDLRQALTQLVALLRPRAEEKGLSLVLDVAAALPAGVLGDRLRLEQALINLVGNAVKFTSRGEVRLAALPDPQVPGMLRFDVVDTGIGIAPDKLEKIFEPFAQADGSVTRLYGGTGLGLSITRNIAHLMGGSVQVYSGLGVGSTFTLRIPLRPAQLPVAEEAPPAAAVPGWDAAHPTGPLPRPTTEQQPKADTDALARASARDPAMASGTALAGGAGAVATLSPVPSPHASPAAGSPARVEGTSGTPLSVLLAEDNEVNAYLFRNMLEGQPVALEFASDGAQALERLRERRYDIAFIDVQMPGIDGLTVTRGLRALEAGSARARTPVVALTANAFASDVRASLDAGCDRHLSKPFSRAQIIEAIQQLAAPPGPPPTAAAPRPVESVLDHVGAVERIGGDDALYGRLAAQAGAYMSTWAENFERERAAGHMERAFRLAHDLRSVASAVGALEVAEHAAMLEQSLRGGAAGPPNGLDEAALRRTLNALPPVVAALAAHRTPPG